MSVIRVPEAGIKTFILPRTLILSCIAFVLVSKNVVVEFNLSTQI